MYTEFFGLKEKPFLLVPNPNYLYFSTKHKNALSFLEYGLTEKVGFVMLTGEIGIGKTTLIRYLLNTVESDMNVAVIFNTNVVSNDLIKLILTEFEVEYDDGIGKAKALYILYNYLIEQYANRKKVLLIIDEAQNLSGDVLEEIRMLSNLQTDDELLLQIMIVGQPNLKTKIQDPALEQFAQRISVSYHLAAMTQKETSEYIIHRLKKAGGSSGLFSKDVIKKIFEASAGIPRTINLLCEAALVYAYADTASQVTSKILEQVITDKGGMGVFTRKDLDVYKQKLSKDDPVRLLNKKIEKMEKQIDGLYSILNKHLKELESRAEFSRTAHVESLKELLSAERSRSAKIEFEYGKVKGRYQYAKLLKQIT